jgi:hypothetical protein
MHSLYMSFEATGPFLCKYDCLYITSHTGPRPDFPSVHFQYLPTCYKEVRRHY